MPLRYYQIILDFKVKRNSRNKDTDKRDNFPGIYNNYKIDLHLI